MKANWPLRSLSSLAERIDYGHTASAAADPVGPKFLRITDIQDDRVDWRNVPYCECSPEDEDASQLRPGDIVFARTGATTGKSFLIRECPDRAIFASYLIRVRLNGEVTPGYVAQFFKSRSYWEQIERSSTGTAQVGVNATSLSLLEIPLAPLAEQRRIATILDKADFIRSKRHAAIEKLDTLAQSIFLQMFGEPESNPTAWPTKPFGELLSAIDSGTSPVCLDRPAAKDEWGILKLGAVTWCEYDELQNKALPHGVAPVRELEVKSGDLLFSRKNTYDLVAACALVHKTRPLLLLPDLIFRFRLRPGAEIEPSYLHRLLIHPTKRSSIQRLAGGSAGSMPNISKARLQTVPIELPPLSLQQEFARRIERLEASKLKVRRMGLALNGLSASLQARAFQGEL
jgi:type I restriction enzyme S subunit